jgi:hypothetical protein
VQRVVAGAYADIVALVGEELVLCFLSVEKGIKMRRVDLCPRRSRNSSMNVGPPRALAVLASLLLAALLGMGFQVEAADAATCTESLQARIDEAPSGGTVVGEPCIYREEITIDKPLTLQGQPGSEIRGSDVWQDWRKRNNGLWISTLSVPAFLQDEPDVFCMPNTTRCKLPEQVFFDGRPFTQVTSLPTKANQFFVNAKRNIILARNPNGHKVEVTTRQHWVLGTTAADGVTIESWTMKHAGTEGRSAALMNRLEVQDLGGERWTVKNNVLSDGHAAIISLTNAPSHEILGNKILRGGMLGIKGAGPGSVIRANEIAYGNTERYCYDSTCGIGGTGGAKFAADVRDIVFDQNVVHDNFGKGVHFDMGCSNNIASNNRIYGNARIGLHMELCLSGKMFGNIIYRNGYATPEGGAGVGLAVSSSMNVEVYDNIIAYNPGGIIVRSKPRQEHPEYDLVHDVFVHDNTIISQDGYLALGWYGPAVTFTSSANNRGGYNRYYYPARQNDNARFAWAGPITRLSEFNATPGEEQGSYLSASEKDAVLTKWQIPASG